MTGTKSATASVWSTLSIPQTSSGSFLLDLGLAIKRRIFAQTMLRVAALGAGQVHQRAREIAAGDGGASVTASPVAPGVMAPR